MKCPWCGHEESNVTRTTKDIIESEPCIVRERKCLNKACGQKWKTYETYEITGSERAFDKAEIASLVLRAHEWLKAPANHVPIVRDVRELLVRASVLLENKN